MSSLPNLSVLLLDYNRLEELPLKITELKSLKRLGVSNNRLSGLPARLSLIRSLEEIKVEGNPFAPALTKAIKKQEVLGYLRGDISPPPTPSQHIAHSTHHSAMCLATGLSYGLSLRQEYLRDIL